MFLGRHQGDGVAVLAGPAGAADAVHVVLRHVGQIKVHHMGQLVDIDAAGGDIGGHQHTHLPALEASQGAGAGSLTLVAVDGGGREALLLKPFGHLVGAMFGAREHQHLLPVIAADQVAEQIRLASHVAGMEHLLHQGRRLVLRGGLQLHRIVEQPLCQPADLGGEGGGEEEVLTLGRQQAEDPADVADEAHVEHPIGLIQHQDLHLIKPKRTLLMEIHQAAWGGHQNISAVAEAIDLGVGTDAAKHHIGAQIEVAAIGHNALGHLGGQFAGGSEDKGPHLAGAGTGAMAKALQHRQGEPGRLAGAGLGRGHHIVALEHGRDAGQLDGGRGAVALGRHGLEQGF